MIKNELRNGNFTSSEIVALTKMGSREMTTEELEEHRKSFPKSKKKKIECWPGDTAITYIQETNFERRLGRSLTDEVFARPLTWGKLLEPFVFNKLGLEYILTSDITVLHPDFDYWAGSKDGYKKIKGKEAIDTVIDIKAPLTLKSFCQLVEPIRLGLAGVHAMNHIRENHKDGEKYYWQLVSNACIENAKYAELIPFMPYEKDIPEIKEMARNVSPEHLSKYYWIAMALDEELPFITEGGIYSDLNIIRFEVPQEDKNFLREIVDRAGKYLDPRLEILLAEHDESLKATIVSHG